MKKITTLCLIHQHPNILLGMKKRGFGEGRWNGFGGKVEIGETIEEAAKRELQEESGIFARDLSKVGIIDFAFQDDPKELEMHIFQIKDFTGEPKESEEMEPRWFDVAAIPFAEMWADDIHWMPLFLSGKKFKGRFLFDRPPTLEYSPKIITSELAEVDEI